MKELIQITYQNNTALVSARALHEGLEIKSNFTTWFNRMLEYGFKEGEDYTKTWYSKKGNLEPQGFDKLSNQEKGQLGFTLDYAITLDMAKEISMIQRTELGKKYRQYFIQREKDAAAYEHIIETTDSKKTLEEYNAYRFSLKKTISTFQYTDPLKLPELIKDFMLYLSDLDTQTRLTRLQSAIKGIERMQDQIDPSTIHLMPLVLVEKEKLQKAHHRLENKRNGGQKAFKTKLIHKLIQNQDTTPDITKFHQLDIHGLSNNYLYERINGNVFKTETYKNWLKRFPYGQLPESLEIDTTKPCRLYLYYTAKEAFDIKNLDKAAIDTIFKAYDLDDNILEEVITKRYDICETYKEGKIYFYIENL